MEITKSLARMGLLRGLGIFIWIALAQIKTIQTQECSVITSISSPSASSLLVRWNSYTDATNYILDLRVVNMSNVAPVVVTVSSTTTQREIFGLKPGTFYTVVIKVFRFYSVECSDTRIARTVPDTSQIISSSAISSTSINLKWDKVFSAEQYFILVNSSISGERYNFSFTNTSATIQNLQPSTSYDCYVFTSNSAGLGARSRVRTVATLVQPPAVITVAPISIQAVRVTWQPVDKVLLYNISVRDNNGTQMLSTTTSSTVLDVHNLLPCKLHVIGVSSVNMFLEPGEAKEVHFALNNLSAVPSVSALYSCMSASAVVTWGTAFGAESYRAIAVDQNGRTVSCTSTGTTCSLTNLGCEKNYVVRVSAIANNCTSISSVTDYFETVTCSPADLNLFRECSSNVIIFSWAPKNNTAFYRAQMQDSTGISQTCITTETSCFFTDTVCGRKYSFTVFGVNGECNGPVSSSVSIHTAPCRPSNLITTSNCENDILTSTWDARDSMAEYIVEARGNRGNDSYESRYSCISNTSSCTIPGVACGESLTMMITASSDNCYSAVLLGQETNTAPCVPKDLLPIPDCSSGSITLRWNMANGALFYFASVTDSSGGTYTCSTPELNCQIRGLRCGTTYNASIISSNFKCNSSVSNKITVETAPCPPTRVQATLDCDGNRALVSWQSLNLPGSYIASMVDQSRGLLNCSTRNSSCWVSSLRCGQVYDVSVTYDNGICPSMSSLPIHMNSVPCGPQNFQTWVDCSTRVLRLTWDKTHGANGYSASVVAVSSGKQFFCNSTSPNCSFSALMCGESYMVQVRSYNGTCFSMLTRPVSIKGVPCPPTNITVDKTCSNHTRVMWQATLGAQSYRVTAVGNKGHQTTCSSNSTTCSLTNLQCGQVYNVSVVAVADACSSIQSQSATLQTGPCVPINIRSTIKCITNDVTVNWDSSASSVSYTGRAVGINGHTVWCNSTSTECQFTGLYCGQDYAITLTASDGQCGSTESEIYTQPTAPCAPVAVSKVLSCDTNTLSVSWTQSPMALSYSAIVIAVNAPVRGCNSPGTSCNISGLQCGLSYTLTVMAANRVCTGPESTSQIIQTAPCIPASVYANTVCISNAVRASWNQAVGALSYTGVLTSPNGSTFFCSTSGLSCEFSGLTCAQTYTLHVFTSNDNCNSTFSTGVTVTTRPCVPYNVVARAQCGSNAVNVSWQASSGASTYTVQAYMQSLTSPSASCVSSNTTCTLTQLQCGTVFNVSVLASDGICNSNSWVGTTVKTAPCPPVLQVFPSSCINNQVMVSWTWIQDALDFTINATSALGHSVSCNSGNNSCTIQGLQCGQRYMVQGTSRGLSCNSAPGVPVSIVTVPCTPVAVRADYACGTSMAVLSWNDSLGRESFIGSIWTQGHSDSCSSNQTYCTLSSLLCGRLYNVSVGAVAGQCNSSSIARTQMQTAPCAPQNVSVSLQCANNTASVSWTQSPGAIGYNVTALGNDGDVKYCRTSNTYCPIPNMHCSQTYNFVVTPFSDVCTGLKSSAFTFTAGPCPPTGVQVSLLCQNNIGSVSWNAAINAENYIATATSLDGFRHNCTTNGTSCVFLDLYCGKNYSITVVTVQHGCWSDPSAPVLLRSAICPPTNLAGVTHCGTSSITITWDPFPLQGVTYSLVSQQDSRANSTFNTTGTSITLNQLQCGWLFTVWVAAKDNTCTSKYSAPVQIHTAPCSPSGLEATAICGTNQGNLTWVGGAGALFYTTTLVSSDGDSISCTSPTTSCVVKLDCEETYTATVISSTGLCNSTANSSTQFTSAPCMIKNVQTQLNCTDNSLAVQWASITRDRNYTALAIGTDGTRTSCSSNGTSCTIYGLRCGSSYDIAVTTSNVRCNIQGSDLQVQTAPCKAENLSVSLECHTSIATVRWNSTGLNQSYSVSAVNTTGGVVNCSTRESYCTFTQFHCGATYTVTVTGVTQACTSQPSNSVNLHAAPCIPTNVRAIHDCATSVTSVMWDMARTADSYVVYAVCSQGYQSNCSTIATNCTFPDLRCGQDYNITVVAKYGSCSSQPSQPFTMSTGPCPHSTTRALLDCSSNSALISWTPGHGIEFYNASANALDVADHVNCSTSGFSCNVTQLQCNQTYQISVCGQGGTCPTYSQNLSITTGPCPPNQVSVQIPCESNVMSISWQISEGSASYLAVVQSTDGLLLSCSSNGTTCNIAGLPCGQTYKVYVSGVVGTCIGPKSQSQIVKTAPCVPQNIQAILECQSTVLNVTWQQSGEAKQYRAMVDTGAGQVMFFVTNKTFFTVPNILCGLKYNVSVMAQNERCNSSHSSVQSVMSAPCPPQTISAIINCTSNTILVNWSSSVNGVRYMAYALSSSGYYTCNSTNMSCSIQVPCGRTYNISVRPIRNGCNGVSSPYKIIKAAPCVPTLASVEMDCLSNSAWVEWNASSGAEFYTAVGIDSDGRRYQCNSSDSMCTVLGLQCGRNYSFSLTAANVECSSGVSNTMQSETVPCAPEGVNVLVGCGTGTVSVRWLPSNGALSYTATLEPPEGMSSCCSTLNNSTSCKVTSLPCGQVYMVTVTAAGQTCNSSQSTAIIVQTAPCQPPPLNATVSCSDNVATVRWSSTAGGQLYTVNAVSIDRTFNDSCNGFDGSCDLRGLVCGLEYTATVVAQHSSCISLPSPPTIIKTVPCIPQYVMLDLNCHARNLTVSWNQTAGVEFYTATVMDSWGHSTNCQSFSNSCSISGLACGNIYHTSVVASDAYCSSHPSTIHHINSVPCAPSNIQAQMDILTGRAILSWYLSAGALRYRAMAVSNISGTSDSCNTNQTNCDLFNILCGDMYRVTVQAMGSICNSSVSMGGYLQTGPCVPVLVNASYRPPHALLLWDMARGADSYTAWAVSPQGFQTSCSSRNNSCVLYNLNCSQIYNITLTAYSHVYQDGVKSNTITLNTEPCPPTILSTRGAAGGRGEVTWEPRFGAVEYLVVLESQLGDTLYCHTTNTSCSVPGLLCGTVYMTRVIAIGSSLLNSSSGPVLLTTVPCLPDPVSFAVAVQCNNDSVNVSWAWSKGAMSYELTATSYNGKELKCVTVQNSCNITNLECGQTYNLSLTAFNSAGAVSLKTGITFQSRPCMPRYVAANLQCGTATAVLTWEQRPGVMYYLGSATYSPGVAAAVCNSTTDTCNFSGLQCGVQYYLRVRAYTEQCWSYFSAPVNITTEPCQVQNLTIAGSCNSSTLQLKWSNATDVVLYTISVKGNLGYTRAFQSPVSSLQVEVPCGQSYMFTVLGQNDQCQSITSANANFSSAPCVPTGVHTFIECENSFASVSWAGSDGAINYTAVAQGQILGNRHTCTTNTTVCTWSNLLCGETYMVRVIARGLNCQSTLSENTTIRMAPCIPQILNASMDCGLRVASLTWASSRAAQLYLMTVENNVGFQLGLTTNSTTAQISELQCGEQYYFKVSSLGQGCRSNPSNSSVLLTDPCPPTAVSTNVNCITNIATITWGISRTAYNYIVKAVDPDGKVTTCMSLTTSCGFSTLQCGQKYDISVTASHLQCNSKPTNQTYLITAPCVPLGVSVMMDCTRNEAYVSWNVSKGAVYYRVIATSSYNDYASCNSSGVNTYCILKAFTCGAVYTVQVVAVGNECSSLPSAAVELHSAPCVPVSLKPSLDCASGAINMTWQPSNGATSYRVLAQRSGGYPSLCNSTSTTCVFTELLCGLTYNFTVLASDSMCSSVYSSSVQINTVPCKPQRLSTYMDCWNRTAFVSWEGGQGVSSYLVQAVGANGYQTQCRSTNTSCSLPNLQCGQIYNITSVGQDLRCNSSAAQGNLQSVPCVPTGVNASLLCSSNSAAVTWRSSSGALKYRADVVNFNGSHTVSCNSSLPSCTTGELLCGTSYNVTVVALDDMCSSGRSFTTQVYSAPCAPQRVQVQMNCTAGAMTVNWAANPDAESFRVDAVGSNVSLSCNTSATSCTIRGLVCGLSLSVTVRAVRGGCQSVPSAATQVLSAPCIPQGQSGNLDCVTNSLWVSWQQAAGTESYQVLAVSKRGANSTCRTSDLFCNIRNLLCGSQYTFQITATNSWCASEYYNNSLNIETGPCSLIGIEAERECNSSSIRVRWLSESSSSIYVVTAEGQDLSLLGCNSTGTSCVLNDARCGMQYAIIVSTSSNKCNSVRSPTYYISTAPCTPQALIAKPLCDTQSVLVSWKPANLSQSYYLTAVGRDGDFRYCNSTTENCTLSRLHCGQTYTVNVSASDGNCTSPISQALTFRTTPCAPPSLNISLSCGNSSATLSWSPSNGSTWYYASAINTQWDKHQCNTTGNSCNITGLQCGTLYNFSVQASDAVCNSPSSLLVQKGTVPCPPASVSIVTRHMENASLVRVSWSTVTCSSVQYLAELNGQFLYNPLALVQVASYWTERTYFEFLMPCDILYTVVVSAGSRAGNGPPSFAINGTTGFCQVYSTNTTGSLTGRRRRDLQAAEILAGLEDGDMLSVPEVTVMHVEGATLHVEWTPVSGASKYTLIVREDTESHPFRVELTVQGEVSDVSDLKPARRYCATLSAKNSITQSAFSAPVCITTGVPI